MSTQNIISVDDGLKTYTIQNKEGKELGTFSFNPSDTNIIKRYEEVISDLGKLEMMESKNTEESDAECLKRMESIVSEKIDYLLNADAAKDFFQIMGPFSPLASGQFFVESVLDAIGKAIQAETGQRVEKMNVKIQKHTAKYHR